MPVTVDLERCDGNAECINACAFSAIEIRVGKARIFDNCTDCGACLLACGPKAIWSELFAETRKAAVLAVALSNASGIAAVVDRAARAADASANWVGIDPANAGGAADALAGAVKDGGYSLVLIPHSGAGPAIAARVAATSARISCAPVRTCISRIAARCEASCGATAVS